MSVPYPTDGWDLSQVSPADAVATMRSLPKRYRSTIGAALDPGSGSDDLLHRRPSVGLSVVEHVVAATSGIQALATALERVLVADDPDVVLPALEPAPPLPGADADPSDALGRLDQAVEGLATTMDGVAPESWTRPGHGGSVHFTAIDLARSGVLMGVRHLRETESTLSDLAGS